jgi:hypothetical protein
MRNVSRPLIALIVGTVAFLALWMVALKPSSSSSGSHGMAAYDAAIAKARQAVVTSNGASAAAAGTAPATASTSPTSTSPAAANGPATRSVDSAAAAGSSARASRLDASSARLDARAAATARQRFTAVERALKANKVLALLFYNPAAADDQAVRQELASVPVYGGHVVKLALPVNDLGRYSLITNQVPVNVSPTLVLIDPDQQATTIVGFADRFEIGQRVLDALSVK